jgi:UDP-N-acetylglucosamine diphosphorylase/glucosamine-1-phosphate N-acetyltransferase
MNIILHDLDSHLEFAPLSLTRPVGNLRMGIFANDERWQNYFPEAQVSFKTELYLSEKFPCLLTNDNHWVNASVIATPEIVEAVQRLQSGQALYVNDIFVAYRGSEFGRGARVDLLLDHFIHLQNRWNLYQLNDQVIALDFNWVKKYKKGIQLDTSNQLIGSADRIFIEEGAKVQGAMLNTTTGPIFIGRNAEVMEGTLVRGALALCENAVLKLGTKVYGATTIGPYCKVGGEVSNVLFYGYSNKGHDGFLGNSIIGEWCNLGADTNTSNLKNNYGDVRTYCYRTKQMKDTKVQFMGLAMGDHSKCGINTMFNTATVVGVSATVFGAGFPPKYIPDFSWSGFDDVRFDFQKAIQAANNMMARRGKQITPEEKKLLAFLLKESK